MKDELPASDLPSVTGSSSVDNVCTFPQDKKLRSNFAACSLVCRSWTHRSRSHFFRDCLLLLHYRNAADFGKLLRSPYCTILPHVRQLTMENNGHCYRAFDDIKEELKLLVGVESLRLSGSSWAVHGAAPRRGFMASLGSVVELEIDCADLGDFDHALLIICAFPSLDRLSLRRLSILPRLTEKRHRSLDSPYMPPSWIQPNESLLRPPPLSVLSLRAPAMIPIIDWLNWTDSCHITCLELHFPCSMNSENTSPLVQYLQNLCGTLEHLTLSSRGTVHITEILDLRNFRNLRTLHFEHAPISFRVPYPLELSLVPLVRRITSPVLESVCFTFHDHRLFPSVSWTTLDDFFSESDFPNLKFVRFLRSTMDNWTNADFTSVVNHSFPRIKALGLLQIEFAAGVELAEKMWMLRV
ncbi:hypothetical protein C8R44DRAFT_798948 [Mycena epipterygia]|nr:hypothetical protein C8R44DRAFT_798948 [Mycena epipterygia]